jgi:hypothetical protein
MPNFTSQSTTPVSVFLAGAKVLAILSADQCFPVHRILEEVRLPRKDHQKAITKIGRARIRNIEHILLSPVQVVLNEANPDGKDLRGMCAGPLRPLMRSAVALLVKFKTVIVGGWCSKACREACDCS